MPRGDRYRALKLGRRESPALSVITGRAVNEAFGHIVAVAPPALGRSLHVQRLTIGVKELSGKGTGASKRITGWAIVFSDSENWSSQRRRDDSVAAGRDQPALAASRRCQSILRRRRGGPGVWLRVRILNSPVFSLALAEVLVPFDAAQMRCFPISTRINSVTNDDPECVVPSHNSSPAQSALFG